ncbi:MAG: radical SAM family heme chaperone HemW [candidate division KSB1 bacterium]|nr:radical SAM family heme chaperone HemW [candidate division KSB1 bacterium]MDZ7275665.1 radical SAM family heme chaperone HemW [candidate division KSB1 bacterium]MDZ7284644.1 radical SAM family heme chaperone HemW [candidate division KSB1 bacterium]MDZ7297937.1 radical SAM family heme chaperone HemW [candidate division KSB1 bacterium]MDZ7348802.1 radical SAM family heme chaperone HemW [candidate division KSB1 bacterium]
MAEAGLYIHIPFCEKRCRYCDFYTLAGSRARIPDYLAALQRELALRAAEPFWQRQRFATIFFGGGTPSLLSPQQIAEILDSCFAHLRFNERVEVTLEANPGTLDGTQMAKYRAVGVNRLSLGVQSFDPAELALLERVHTPQQALIAAQNARYAGFENLNLDFMFALPNQTLARWQHTLEQAVALAPEHLSAYNLTIEPGTPIHAAMQRGELKPLTQEEEREFFAFTIDFLEQHGYQHYEISNFAKPGFAARHNLKYWDGSPYLGLGASAHSFDGRRRCWNVANLRKYLERLAEGRLAQEGEEKLTPQQRMFEFAFLGLRQRRGIALDEFAQKFKMPLTQAFNGELHRLQAQGLLIHEDGYLRLSREGVFLCDEICARLAP